MNSPNILVTGANGFIGRELIHHLLDQNPRPRVVCAGLRDSNIEGAQDYSIDLTDEAAVREMVAETLPSTVYHFAGSSRVSDSIGMPEYFTKNFLTTVSLINALKTLDQPVKFFFASSVHVYGNQDGVVREDSPTHPVSNYGFTKFLAEEALKEFAASHPNVTVVVGRLSSCVGPGQAQGFVASDLCRKISRLKSEDVLNVGPLSGYRRFLDVRDGVNFFPELLKSSKSSYEVFNIASPHELQIKDVLKTLLAIAGKSPTIHSSDDLSSNKLKGLELDLHKIEQTLPEVTYRPIDKTLREMYEWVTANPGK